MGRKRCRGRRLLPYRFRLPKGKDSSTIDKEHIAQLEYLINNRPRKCLRFKTPLEVVASSVALRG
jgi:IS30 family transposase